MAKQKGRGSVEQVDENTFIVRVFLGRNGNGKQNRKAKTVHGSRKNAEKVLTALLAQDDKGLLTNAGNITLNAYLDQWLETVKPNLRTKARRSYPASLQRYIREPLGAKKLNKLTTMDVQAAYNVMAAKGLAKATMLFTHTVFKQALGQAVEWGMLTRNPADHAKLPKSFHTPKFYAMNPEEIARFRDVARLRKWYVLFELMLGTGVRPGEALGLTWRDVDLAKGIIKINKQLTYVNKKEWLFEEPKTVKGKRNITLPISITALLTTYKSEQQHLGLPNPHNLVFHAIDGLPASSNGIAQATFNDILEKAALPKHIRLYDLRHTHATLLMQTGLNPKIVSERLGHASIKITLDTYSHVLPNMQAEAADKLEALVYAEAVNFLPKATGAPN
jgi:integrase